MSWKVILNRKRCDAPDVPQWYTRSASTAQACKKLKLGLCQNAHFHTTMDAPGTTNMNLLQKAGSDDDDAAQSLLQLGVNGTVSSGEGMALSLPPPPPATDEIWDKGKFPVQLHCALRDMEREGMAHIASWAPHGRCFHVYNLKEFVDLVLGRYVRGKH
jgi:hypothetical protein